VAGIAQTGQNGRGKEGPEKAGTRALRRGQVGAAQLNRRAQAFDGDLGMIGYHATVTEHALALELGRLALLKELSQGRDHPGIERDGLADLNRNLQALAFILSRDSGLTQALTPNDVVVIRKYRRR